MSELDKLEREILRKKRLADSQEPGFKLEEYIRQGRHREGCPGWLTCRQLDVLIRYVPGPLGLGMEVKNIARSLDLNRKTIHRINKEIQLRFPKAWKRIKAMREVMSKQRDCFARYRSLDAITVFGTYRQRETKLEMTNV